MSAGSPAAPPSFRLSAAPSHRPLRHLAVLRYDGTDFCGWQIQAHGRSVQGELERAIEQLTGHRVRAHASGRTDAGVHARQQPVHFDLPLRPDLPRFQLGLNALLPPDVRVLSVRRVGPGFHARYSCVEKEYRYFIDNSPVPDPILRHHRAWERRRLDVTAMRAAATRLVGRHDFAAFAANPNREIAGTVRDLRRLDVRRQGSTVIIVAVADGFLYRMVRSLAGFLIRVGRGELEPHAADAILAGRVRTARVPTAPPQGLFLWRVRYPPGAMRALHCPTRLVSDG
ncbi:MAG: tRNA pseudouridine(38-40) synthase TruA [Kiritimatiellae bacterium]|nr:tRNA pseudouridine(38-40) synthase TruA [Kiritimatiellia bacterium]